MAFGFASLSHFILKLDDNLFHHFQTQIKAHNRVRQCAR